MRKLLWCKLILTILLAACQDPAGSTARENQIQLTNNGAETTELPTVSPTLPPPGFGDGLSTPAPHLKVTPNRDVTWNALVSLTARDMPPGQTIYLQAQLKGETDAFVLGQASVGGGGEFATEVRVPAGVFGRTLEIFALSEEGALLADTSLTYGYSAHVFKVRDEKSGFSLTIPDVWEASDTFQTPLGEMILLGPRPLVSGDPATSMILHTSLEMMSVPEAASFLACGTSSCLATPSFETLQIAGLPAKRLVIGTNNTPALEWFFLEVGDRLIFFTLHDPVTLQTIPLLLESIELESVTQVQPQPTPISTNTPSPTSTPTPEPTQVLVLPTATPPPTEAAASTAEPSPPEETSTPEPNISEEFEQAAPDSSELIEPGPLQTVTDFILIIIRREVDDLTAEYLSEDQRRSNNEINELERILNLGFNPLIFTLERQQTAGQPVIIQADFSDNQRKTSRRFYLIIEGERWRIDDIVDVPKN